MSPATVTFPQAARPLAPPQAARLTPTRSAIPALDAFVPSSVQDAGLGALRSLQALPSFIYPAVSGTAAEKQVIFEALSRLPLKDISAISAVRMVPSIGTPSSAGVTLGVTRVATGDIALSRWGNSFYGTEGSYVHGDTVNPDMLRYTVLHEAGHAHDYQGGSFRMFLGGPESSHGPWGKAPYLTDYARTNAHEDFAEAHAHYYQSTEELQRVPGMEKSVTLKDADPVKYRALHQGQQSNFMERLVDQPAFRETGKLIGEWTSVAPLARSGVALLSSITVMSLMTGGAQELAFGLQHDARTAVHGALGLAAGVGIAAGFASPLLGPAALALLGARRGVDVAQGEGAKATAAAAVGGALGGAIGGVAGPLGGTYLGYTIGGPIGGVVGLVAGSLLGFKGGSELGARAGLAVAR